MQWSQEGKWITSGFGLAIVLMGAVSLTSYHNATELVKSASQVRQTNDVLDSLNNVSTALSDANTRWWSYILFNRSTDLEQYKIDIERIQPILDRLREPLSDTPSQQQHFDRLEQLIVHRLLLMEASIEQVMTDGTTLAAADPLIAEVLQNRNQIRQVIDELEDGETELLQAELARSQQNLRFQLIIEPLGTLLTFGILLGVYLLLYRQMMKRQQAEARQQTLAQQQELSELKLQLFSMVSHEFRTPLSLILGSAQLLDETLKQTIEPAKLKNLHRIQSSAKLLTRLLSDILTLARADAGKLDYTPEWVEMQTFCLNLVEDLQVVSDVKRSFKFTQEGESTHAYVDEKLLYSILNNLLSNAVKYSAVDSTIYFTMGCTAEALTFRVQDEGMGIPLEEQPHLYDPFMRGSHTREIMGTGLGLAVVKKCLDLHHGSITVDSQVGRGTTFTIVIPQPDIS